MCSPKKSIMCIHLKQHFYELQWEPFETGAWQCGSLLQHVLFPSTDVHQRCRKVTRPSHSLPGKSHCNLTTCSTFFVYYLKSIKCQSVFYFCFCMGSEVKLLSASMYMTQGEVLKNGSKRFTLAVVITSTVRYQFPKILLQKQNLAKVTGPIVWKTLA